MRQRWQCKCLINGAGEWNRTTDLRFTKPLLCQLSYAGLRGVADFANQKRDLTQDVKHLSMQRCDLCRILLRSGGSLRRDKQLSRA
ncbi:hypothetical protein NSPZN2_10392 [Nitrospira defluvii]|uniref:Uncharacterized protein n=1 Tax=Nitrospira defluvii TaxID=330214 RepID=A0ABM8QFN4_9BACT|nr:hypothetical protein NSPZN2_10392 [Nitrospira defluvii]